MKLKASKREWDHTCGDGCCYEYHVEMGFTKENGEYVFGLRNYQDTLSFDDVLVLLRALGYELDVELIDDLEVTT